MISKNLFTFCLITLVVLSRYLKNATNNIFSMLYLRTSSLRHKFMQDNFRSARFKSTWERSCFCITNSNITIPNYSKAMYMSAMFKVFYLCCIINFVGSRHEKDLLNFNLNKFNLVNPIIRLLHA